MLLKLYNLILNFFFKYPTPSNLNNLWNFGVLALIFLSIQFITGVFLSMFYIPNTDLAFFSIENIMRNVNSGWLIRYIHANGASFFFVFVYLHLFRNLYYKSYLPPRRAVWLWGVFILLIMIITAFTGYVLPWGQMSFRAATVITNLFSSIPIFGNEIVFLLWGNYTVSNSTLNRFFSFHFLLPFLLIVFTFLHLIFLHEKGSSNPLKVYLLNDKVLFDPYYTIKDIFIVFSFFVIFMYIFLFDSNLLGHSDNYIKANPLVTPTHIVPEWYFLLFYAILRAVPSKLGGFLVLLLSIFILFIFPFFFKKFNILNKLYNYNKLFIRWLDLFNYINIVKKEFFNQPKTYFYYLSYIFLNFLNWYNFWKFILFFYHFLFVCICLSILGSYPAEGSYLIFSKFFMFMYFFYFFFLIIDMCFSYVSVFFIFIYFYFIFFYSYFFKFYKNNYYLFKFFLKLKKKC